MSNNVVYAEPFQYMEKLGQVEVDGLREKNRKLNEKSSQIMAKLNEANVNIFDHFYCFFSSKNQIFLI